MASIPAPLFEPDVPNGFHYREHFLTIDEEAALVEHITHVQFSNFEMRGVVARRRVAFFGSSYDNRLRSTVPMPDFLQSLRDRIGRWAGVDGDAFAMALINEYRPGAPIGWHRDASQFEMVGGVSLLSSCRLRFRPYAPAQAHKPSSHRRRASHELSLAPRSAYLLTAAARDDYEHSIPAVTTLRYSITFRTARV